VCLSSRGRIRKKITRKKKKREKREVKTIASIEGKKRMVKGGLGGLHNTQIRRERKEGTGNYKKRRPKIRGRGKNGRRQMK